MTNAEYLRASRAHAVANRLCIECRLRRPAEDHLRTCEFCLEAHRIRASMQRAQGLCRCGQPLSPRSVALCTEHLAKDRERMRRRVA